MLSSVLNSGTAIKVNIQVIRAFTKIRSVIADTTTMRLDIEELKTKMLQQGKNIELVFSYLDELIDKQENKVTKTKIGYK